ncbi:hypothetical protein IHE45_01G010400 [Dioscorea alata]|uniref:Uncharacterized protein n=1 Tax=Dioscorea alata TaxID=55571 RepID=A0ACB7WSB8_DIOAL|nr:hypothetical protein IHE45_01G010400 [Dioscorea alata]
MSSTTIVKDHRNSKGMHWWRSVSLKQVAWKLRYQWRHAMKSRRKEEMRFGYDHESYIQNFDDGVLSDNFVSLSLVR